MNGMLSNALAARFYIKVLRRSIVSKGSAPLTEESSLQRIVCSEVALFFYFLCKIRGFKENWNIVATITFS
jgi:hypothetical protein